MNALRYAFSGDGVGTVMTDNPGKSYSRLNRSIVLTPEDCIRLRSHLLHFPFSGAETDWPSGIFHGDCMALAPALPQQSIDLLILDPPYNLNKTFNGRRFNRQSVQEYTDWLDGVLRSLMPLLKDTATVYICGDWFSSPSIFAIATEHLIVRNRITWEREKGRGAKANWKNASEDIWFCTVSDRYTFNLEAVKQRRRVLAPYRDSQGQPRDWQTTEDGSFRDTYPSNLWTDITIPFWSMPENTLHPTQKSEKLLAKLLLASSNAGDLVLDPFLGSGTTTVTAKKLGRRYWGIDIAEDYCLFAARRLELADTEPTIQGWVDGVFWERNTFAQQQSKKAID
jgi:site-specific DNA-methyltransferase (adenine-specific)